MRDLQIVFMGTPDFAVTILKHLVENKYTIVGVITAPDKPAGRGRKLSESAVKKYAVSQNLTVLQPTNLKSKNFIDELTALKANLQIVVAFRMLPKVVWQMPEFGTFNLHASLLPEYRGAAPINWAIINGETKTGVTTFFIDDKIDTGEIILQKEIVIRDNEIVGELHDRLMHLGADLVLETLQLIKEDNVILKKQPEIEEKTAYKLFPETCKIDWTDSLENIYNKVSKEFVKHTDTIGKIISTKKVLKVAVLNGYLIIDEIKLAGKKKMETQNLLNGFQFSSNSKMA